MTKDEMENKSRAFITEISEILGLGKPIDILKLCATTELFFKPLEERIIELEKENAELKEQIEKMKCCENCRYYSRTYEHCYSYESYQSCTSLSNWRLAE